MAGPRPLALAAGALAAFGLAVLLAASLGGGRGDANLAAAQVWLLAGAAVVAAHAAQLHAVQRFAPRQPDARRVAVAASVQAAAFAALALAHLAQPSGLLAWAAFAAGLALFAASIVHQAALVPALPRRSEAVTDLSRDPLSKGDDACLKQVRFAGFLLPLGGFLVAAQYLPVDAVSGTAWAGRFHLAAIHAILAGYVLLSTYAVTHLWIPRFSGVPAIAPGAIRGGELHPTLLGVLLVVAGFLSGLRGLRIAGGAFLFLAAFTWMGVLGANIMKNKSRTQRVTLEFAYVPWAFAGVFWLVCAVLLGTFLNAVPALLAPRADGLRFVHAAMGLVGGFGVLLVGLATRLAAPDRPPVSFATSRWAFAAANLGLAAVSVGALATNLPSPAGRAGAVLLAVAAAACFIILARADRSAP